MKCKYCSAETANPRFCSKSCAAKFNNAIRGPRSEESKLKTSKSLSGRKHPAAQNPEFHPRWSGIKYHPCNNCGKIISNPRRNTCSIECRDSIRSQNGTLTRRVSYNNMIFQSNWEVIIAKFLDENNIEWLQPHKRITWYDNIQQKTRTYLPDFYLPKFNKFLDVKNPIKQLQDADKISQLKKNIPLEVGDILFIKTIVARLAGLEPTCIH